MPKYAYGDDWEKLISKLNLEDADDEVVTLSISRAVMTLGGQFEFPLKQS